MVFPLAVFTLVAAASSSLRADDWPQWRGPHRDGVSAEKGLLKEWPKEGPKLLWERKDIGSGFSTPSVVGDAFYLLANEGLDKEFVKALRVSDGNQIWETPIGKVGNPDQKPAYPGARSTPTVDGESLYALGSDGDLVCLETATGKVRWQKSLRKDFGGQPGVWAYAESPLIDGDTLVCTPGGAEATMVALNKKTGEVLWKAAVPGGDQAAYASVIPTQAAGAKQYIQFLQKGLVGVDAASGKFLWRYEKTAEGSPANIPSPVADDSYIYSATGRGGGGLVHLTSAQGAITAEPVYAEKKLPASIGGTVKIGDYLYGTTGESVLCLDFKSGAIKWQERGIGAASICFADGDLYLHGENGQVSLVEATPDGYHEKGRFTPPSQPDRGSAKAWAYPVVANGRLYIHDVGVLWCYDVKAVK